MAWPGKCYRGKGIPAQEVVVELEITQKMCEEAQVWYDDSHQPLISMWYFLILYVNDNDGHTREPYTKSWIEIDMLPRDSFDPALPDKDVLV